jgi:predicted acylesterase/phospholipase RssA
VPGMFSPVEHDGRVLVDGGLLVNVPIGEVRTMTTLPIIAVRCDRPTRPDTDPRRQPVFSGEASGAWMKRLRSDTKERSRFLMRRGSGGEGVGREPPGQSRQAGGHSHPLIGTAPYA